MNYQPLPPAIPNATLADYDKAYATFRWEDVEPEFDWHRTGRVNMAHEAYYTITQQHYLMNSP